MRAPPLLLLMVAASLAVSPLSRLNSELSACDLEEERWRTGGQRCIKSCQQALNSSVIPMLCTQNQRLSRLKKLHLSSCCERTALSALDASARLAVYNGGASCEKTLRDLLELDYMVARLDCSFDEIMQRYDCQQNYSVRHSCADCQETYRHWLCATLIPLHMEDEDISLVPSVPLVRYKRYRGERGAGRGVTGDDAARRREALEIAGHLDRRWESGGVIGRWVRAAAAGPGRPMLRLKPCLGICELVEQHCPYFLPADRAPAYPTQYAGEPTFLCLDPMIPETGEQADKSNYGPDDCCYTFCNGTICAHCAPHHRVAQNSSSHQQPTCTVIEDKPSTCASSSIAITINRALIILIIMCRTIRTVIQLCNETL